VAADTEEFAYTNSVIDPPLYQDGTVEIYDDVLAVLRANIDLADCLFGIQVAADGRVWVCVNGITFLRFKPRRGAPS
jgi:hypothetical protein